MNVNKGIVQGLLLANKAGHPLSSEQRLFIKQYVIDTLLSVEGNDIEIDQQIQSQFPQEWDEAQDAIDIRDGRMKKMYIATVQLAFYADSDAEACDAVSGMLSENLVQNGALVDWQYQSYNGVIPHPTCIGYKQVELEEGEAFVTNNRGGYILVPEN